MPEENALATLAQLMQLSQAASQPQQQQQDNQMRMALQAMALQQAQQQHAAEQQYKQAALAQSQSQFDQTLELRNQQEAAAALNTLERQGPLKMDPYTLALIEQAYPKHAPAIKQGMFQTKAAELMGPVQQAYAQYNDKKDLATLQKGLAAYLPAIWEKQHPEVQAKMGEMFDALNQGMQVPTQPPITSNTLTSQAIGQGLRKLPGKVANLITETGTGIGTSFDDFMRGFAGDPTNAQLAATHPAGFYIGSSGFERLLGLPDTPVVINPARVSDFSNWYQRMTQPQ